MGMLIDAHADTSTVYSRAKPSTLLLDGRKNPWPAAVGPTIFVDVDPPPPQPGRDLRPGAGGDPL
jgi:gamma-glutamyl-gamma-aminobutyraldehyde dehydrogenase